MSSSFSDLVKADLKTEEVNPFLCSPENLEPWRAELVDIIQSIESQMPRRRADLEEDRAKFFRSGDKEGWIQAKIEFDRWKSGALNVKRMAVLRLAIVREMLKEQHVNKTRDELRRSYYKLHKAIVIHREVVEGSYDPTSADLDLWAVLDDLNDPAVMAV